jgi:anti-sigma B factor antagonist
MPDDVQDSQPELLRVEATYEDAEATISVAGELDVSTAGRFVACVRDALETQRRSINIDARALEFSDSSGLAALLRARGPARDVGVAFRISSPSPKLRRLVEVSGTEDYLLPDQ